MNVFIICSLKSVQENYDKLVWTRSTLLANKCTIGEDWIHHRIDLQNNKPRFIHSEGFDYLKVAIDQIILSDVVIVFLTSPSTYISTLLRYAVFNKKKIILIYSSKAYISRLSLNEDNIIKLQSKSYKQLTKYL